MRDPNLGSVEYTPQYPPVDNELSKWVYNELQRISAAVSLLALGHLDETHVTPAKPRKGDIRYADGTNWNPGSGTGIYYFNGTTWTKL